MKSCPLPSHVCSEQVDIQFLLKSSYLSNPNVRGCVFEFSLILEKRVRVEIVIHEIFSSYFVSVAGAY